MGCQSQVDIGKNLTFSITTHDPDTGVLTDADAAPAYRVYEDETATAILTGNMATLDTANTTGFYSEQIACTAANGFEDGKSYTIYIEATVDGDTGGISYAFEAVTPGLDTWAYASRTLTQSAASVAAAVAGSAISVQRLTSWSIALTGLGSIAGRTKLWFTMKRAQMDDDNKATVQIEETSNLLYVNGSAAAVAGSGTLTVNDEDAGDITIALDETVTTMLAQTGYYDVKWKTAAAAVLVATSGTYTISDTVTHVIA